MTEPEATHRPIPLVWVGVEDLPLQLVNQFTLQHEGEEVYLTLGTVTPPIIVGSPDDVRDQVERLEFVEVRPVARVAMSPKGLHALKELLDRVIENDGLDEDGGQ